MAWTLVKETFKQEFSDNINGRAGTRIYIVFSDTKILDNDAVLDADDGSNSIPAIGDAWSVSKAGLTVSRRRVKELDDGKLCFNVIVDYETPSGQGVSGSDDPDPTARPWEVSTGTNKTEINAETTLVSTIGSGLGDILLDTGKSIVNAASDPIEAKETERTTILNLSKNYADFTDIHASITNLADLKAFEGLMNDGTVTIAGINDTKWTFLLDEINAVSGRENEIDFIRVTYRIIHNRNTHIKILLNAGLNKLVDDGAGGKLRVPIMNKGVPVKKPAMLDVSGSPIAATDPAVAVATGTYVAAGTLDEVDYSTLGLPTTFN